MLIAEVTTCSISKSVSNLFILYNLFYINHSIYIFTLRHKKIILIKNFLMWKFFVSAVLTKYLLSLDCEIRLSEIFAILLLRSHNF